MQMLQEPTNYEDFKDIPPYNLIKDGNWKRSLTWYSPHPLFHMIIKRFSYDYDGKLLWRELNAMKNEIEKLKNALSNYEKEVWPRMGELRSLIKEERKLCGKECKEKFQKHLETCPGGSNAFKDHIHGLLGESEIKHSKNLNTLLGQLSVKCNDNYIAYECEFGDNGRCSHYYELKSLEEDLECYESDIHEYEIRIINLEVEYRRALAIKENRLQEYLDSIDDL